MNVNTPIARILCFLVPFVYLTATGLVLHCVLAGRKPEHFGTVVLANVFISMLPCGIFLSVSLSQWRDQCTKRDRTIAEMNHHVRNALSVLAFYGAQANDEQAQAAVSQAIQRIEWTLEEVLPAGWSPQPETYLSQKVILSRLRRVRGSTAAEARQR